MPPSKKNAPASDDFAENQSHDLNDGIYDLPTSPSRIQAHSQNPEKKNVGSRQGRHAGDPLQENLAASSGSRHNVYSQASPKRKKVGLGSKRQPKRIKLPGMEEADENNTLKADMTQMTEPVVTTIGSSSSGHDFDSVGYATTESRPKTQAIPDSQETTYTREIHDTQQIPDSQLPDSQEIPTPQDSHLITVDRCRQGQGEPGRSKANPAETAAPEDGFTAATAATLSCLESAALKDRLSRAFSSDVGQHQSSESGAEAPDACHQTSLHAVFNELSPVRTQSQMSLTLADKARRH